MSVIATAVKHLIAAGVTGDALLAAIAELEVQVRGEPKRRSAGAERQARYHARLDVSGQEWQRLRSLVFERDGHTCTYCGSEGDLACDHVIPLIRGGSSTLENLTTACRRCNSEKSGRAPADWRP